EFGFEVALLLVKEAGSIGNQVLQVAQLRPVHGWVIDFGDDAIPKRKPDLAGSRVCGSDSVFATMGPSGMNSRASKRSVLIVQLGHLTSPVLSLSAFGFLSEYRS